MASCMDEMFRLKMQNYTEQRKNFWPQTGRHILAQFDDNNIVLYQAFSVAIADYAVENQKFGGRLYSFDRMTWVKTNFLWMMYRSGWATKPSQERILAIHISREGFQEILRASAESKRDKGGQNADPTGITSKYFVRLQWDPDHFPGGEKHETRRAIQLGLKGDIVHEFNDKWIQNIQDITDFVNAQYTMVVRKMVTELITPCERVYIPSDEAICRHIRLDGHLQPTKEEGNIEDGLAMASASCLQEDDRDLKSEVDVADDMSKSAITPRKMILCLGGAFNPVHTQHIQAMVIGKKWLEEHVGVEVVAGRLAVAPDGYVKAKTQKTNQKCMKADHRIQLCAMACEDHRTWLEPYPGSCGSAMECGDKTRKDMFGSSKEAEHVRVAVIVGADRAVNKTGRAKWHNKSKHYTVCIGRKGETSRVIDKYEQDKRDGKLKSEFIFVPDELENISSTAVRRVLSQLDEVESHDEKRQIVNRLVSDEWISKNEGDYILENEADLYLS